MKDIAGQPLAVGDRVAVSQVGYRNFVVGTIARFTPKGMKVHIPSDCRWGPGYDETFRTPDMVAKVPSA